MHNKDDVLDSSAPKRLLGLVSTALPVFPQVKSTLHSVHPDTLNGIFNLATLAGGAWCTVDESMCWSGTPRDKRSFWDVA